MSGGQRQRIGSARALYKDSKVLVFDESTSSLDEETEKKVMENIYKFNSELTIIIISHRISTLKKCSTLIEISNQSVKEIPNNIKWGK